MPGHGIYDTVRQAIQDVIARQLQELRGDITGFCGEIGGELTGLRAEMRQIEKRMEDGFNSMMRWRCANGWRRWKLG